MSPSQQTIDSLLQQIIAIAHPLRVVLFGSAARGEWRASSDIDMLIVVPEGSSMRDVARRLYASIRGIRVPFDLVVATPAVLKKHERDSGMVYRHALQEGRELYAA
jgi:predicted nucleotidyltransferase